MADISEAAARLQRQIGPANAVNTLVGTVNGRPVIHVYYDRTVRKALIPADFDGYTVIAEPRDIAPLMPN